MSQNCLIRISITMLLRAHSIWKFNVCFLNVICHSIFALAEECHMKRYRYFVNQSYAQRDYNCTEEEGHCILKDKIYYPEDGRCYSVGLQGPCRYGESFHVDEREATSQGGHIRGTCNSICKGVSLAPLALTGECHTRREIENKICLAEWGLRPAKNAFGAWVCEWRQHLCPLPTPIPNVKGEVCSAANIFMHPYAAKTLKHPRRIGSEEAARQPETHPWHEFFGQESDLSREFSCSEAERECLSHGRLLYPRDGNCYQPGERPKGCEQPLRVDAQNGSLRSTCEPPCPGATSARPLAATGVCLDDTAVKAQICREEWGMRAVKNIFGQWQCECLLLWNPLDDLPTRSSYSPVDEKPGVCVRPDFSNPTEAPTYDETLAFGFRVTCSEDDFACLKQGKVFAEFACHALRTRGPCAERGQLVLDKGAVASGMLFHRCQGPCPEGSVHLRSHGQCLSFAKATSLLCPGMNISLDEFGGWQCDVVSKSPANLSHTRYAGIGICMLPTSTSFAHKDFKNVT